MFKLRKINRRHIITIGLIFSVYLLIAHLLSEPKEFQDNKIKIELIEQSIRSDANQEQCRMPQLPVDSPEMLKFLKNEPAVECGHEKENWVQCKKSTCSIRKSIVKEKGSVTCEFTDILRKDDYRIKYGESVRTDTAYTLKQSDFVRVKCWSADLSRWSGILFGIRESATRTNTDKAVDLKLNVLMYGFDSLSRNAFIRKLPSSYKYLKYELNGDVLEGYNIVGDGTPQALIPLLTGFTELELPETRKRMKGSDYVNVYPMIWKDYSKGGYVTAFNEDVPFIGTFSYRLNGFDEQPTDHYMRTYYLAIQSEIDSYSRLCVGHVPRHKVMMDYTTQFMQTHTNQPRFVFSFHGELSHDSINLIGVADKDLTNWLAELKLSGILNSTVLILMSDHGNRFAEVRNTLQGKQEERLPFFSFVFPEWFKTHYKQQYANFKSNVHRLSTPFDVHATLEDILRIQSSTYGSIKKPPNSRSISLFDEILSNRSCADAYIEPHWCACLNWHPLNDTTTEIVHRAAFAVVNQINEYTADTRHQCAALVLDEVKWAAQLSPHDNLVRFKQNRDMDGYLADLTSSTTRVLSDMYQVKITLSPGGGIFEASLTHELHGDTFTVKLSDVSRVNKYGDQAKCILDSNPELRKFCYCI